MARGISGLHDGKEQDFNVFALVLVGNVFFDGCNDMAVDVLGIVRPDQGVKLSGGEGRGIFQQALKIVSLQQLVEVLNGGLDALQGLVLLVLRTREHQGFR